MLFERSLYYRVFVVVGKYFLKLLAVAACCWYICVPAIFWAFNAIFYRRKGLSKITDDMLFQSATQLSRRIRNREITCSEVVDSFINRIETVNPLLNVVVEGYFSEARSSARLIDDMLNDGTAPPVDQCPFLGLPFTLKDSIFVKGRKCTAGIPKRKDFVPDVDAVVVRRMLEAGGIHLGTTNVSEVGMWWETYNTIYGRSRNPYDLRRITGGSSGGEGSVLASAGSAFGIGSDIGGSIRMPAFFNGIFGHKPTKRIVSSEGTYPPCVGYHFNMFSPGPMCRYAEDLLPMLKVLAGSNGCFLKLDQPVDVSQLKIFYMEGANSFLWSPLHADMRKAMRKVIKYFENRYNKPCFPLDLPSFRNALYMWINDMENGRPPSLFDIMTDQEESTSPQLELFRWLVGRSEHTFPAVAGGLMESMSTFFESPKVKEKLAEKRQYFFDQLQNLLEDDGVFLFPPHPTPAPFHNQPLLHPFNYAYTAIFNSLGLPVTQCPLGLNSEGIPLGIQVAAALHNDHLTIAVARELEKVFGGWVEP